MVLFPVMSGTEGTVLLPAVSGAEGAVLLSAVSGTEGVVLLSGCSGSAISGSDSVFEPSMVKSPRSIFSEGSFTKHPASTLPLP